MPEPTTLAPDRWLPAAYGLAIGGGFPFTHRLDRAPPPADVVLEVNGEEPGSGWHQLYASARKNRGGDPLFELFRRDGQLRLCCLRRVEMVVGDRTIHARPLGQEGPPLLEIQFLSAGLALWMEARGTLALHASALALPGDRSMVLCGGHRAGKSLLALELVCRGLALVSDDILPVALRDGVPVARGSFPQMRLWPEAARHRGIEVESLPRVHPSLDKRLVPIGADGLGSFAAGERRISAVYLLDRRPAELSPEPVVDPLSPASAVVALAAQSFLGGAVAAAGWQPRRLSLLARLVERVPVRRVLYPEGFDRLPDIVDSLLADAEEVSGR